ncbi:MAG TPA: hypothetical protein PKA63_02665 [Oligoflexia bacterium]|nr:hypothetical protein [Oligoflexia bacterium]HMP47555.1 hypothetical protein [Oligoflexia bacterium]
MGRLYFFLFWGLVLFCFMVQARYLDFPLEHVPYYAFFASWLFIVNQGTKVIKQNQAMLISRKKSKRK